MSITNPFVVAGLFEPDINFVGTTLCLTGLLSAQAGHSQYEAIFIRMGMNTWGFSDYHLGFWDKRGEKFKSQIHLSKQNTMIAWAKSA